MNAAGTRPRNITAGGRGHPYHATQPAWSPSGSKIVFVDDDLFVVNADGSGLKQLTDIARTPGVGNYAPAWSPDGKTIVFVRTTGDKTGDPFIGGELWAINSDGSRLRPLGVAGTDPDWSPDSLRLTFASNRNGNLDIYVTNADGSGQRRLADRPGTEDYGLVWSPDGSMIVFASQASVTNSALWVMNTN